MSEVLRFDLLANDKASAVFDRLGKSVNDTETGFAKLGSKMASFGKAVAAGGLAAVGAGVAIKKGLIDPASDLSETMNKATVVFGKNAAGVISWSKSSATSFGLSQTAALGAASQFGDMFTQLGFTGKAAASTSKNLVKTAADLGSFHNVDPTDVLERIGGALRGEYDSLQQLIPNISATRVEHAALAATGKKSADALTAQEKATAALAIIQKDGKNAANDFAETSGGAANQQRIFTAQLEDLRAKLGGKLVPVFATGMQHLTTFVGGMQSGTGIGGAFVDKMQTLGAALVDVGSWVAKTAGFLNEHRTAVVSLGIAVGALVAVTQAHAAVLAVQAAGGLAAMIKGLPIVTALTKTWAAVQWVLNAALTANPIGLVVVGLAALGAGLVIAYKKSETFREVVHGALRAVSGAFTNLAEVGRNMLGGLQERWSAFKDRLVDIKEAIGRTLSNIFDPIQGAWTSAREWVGERWAAFREFVGGWQEALTGRLSNLFGGIRDAWTSTRTWVEEKWGAFKDWIGGLSLNFDGIFDGLAGAFKAAVNQVIAGWNNLSFSIPGFNPPGPGNFPGVTIGTPNIPMLADGGIVTRPTLAVVGEAGPEAVIPLSKMGSGQVTNHYEFHIHDATDPQRVVAAIHTYVKRNGPVRGIVA